MKKCKKHAIIIGEDNEELSRKVQEALFAVGFKWYCDEPVGTFCGEPCIDLNLKENGTMTYTQYDEVLHAYDEAVNSISPSYVLEHASELDGAKKVDPLQGKTMEEWLRNECHIAFRDLPEVVKDEICKHNIADLQFYCKRGGEWCDVTCNPRISIGSIHRVRQPKRKLTVAEICEELGEEIEIIR